MIPGSLVRSRGFTLIELMIAMLLGLLVVAAAGAIFVSNRQTYVATESLGRVQESARTAFELMARDIREAGGNPCDRRATVANVVDPTITATWWAAWNDGVVGFGAGTAADGLAEGSGVGERVPGVADAIEIKSAHSGTTVEAHDASAAQFTVNAGGPEFAAGDLALVCDYAQASLFWVEAAGGGVISHDLGSGNCTKGLGLPVTCDGGSGMTYIYPKNSTIAKVSATRWYIGNNDEGGRSLFRQTRRSATSGVDQEEVVRGVTGMTLEYLVPGNADYVAAGSVVPTQWSEVTAVRVALNFEGDERVGTAGERIGRQVAYVASLRNRLP